MDVRDTFKLMMRNEVSPALREIGFKGSGVNFSLPHPVLHRLIHFQTNVGDAPEKLSFTVNVAMIDKAEYERKWQPWMPKQPTAAAILPVGRQFRIGALVGGEDKWWQIGADEATGDQAHDAVRLIHDYVVPELQRGSLRGPSLNREQYDDS